LGKAGLATTALVLLPALLAPAAWSGDVIQDGRTVTTPQQLNRHPQAVPPSHIPGSAHQHVYQRQEYGKGFREGHSVSGPYGNITIWSASPSGAHPTPAQIRPGHQRIKPAVPLSGPRLQYVPDYGKPKTKDR